MVLNFGTVDHPPARCISYRSAAGDIYDTNLDRLVRTPGLWVNGGAGCSAEKCKWFNEAGAISCRGGFFLTNIARGYYAVQ